MKVRDHGQRDVGVEQGAPDLADGGVDIGFGEPALAAKVAESGCQSVGQAGEHGSPFGVSGVV